MDLILYSGPGCGLCEQAKELISQLEIDDLRLEVINVKSSTELYHLYGARIPVLKLPASNANLYWPFDLTDLQVFIS